MVTPTINVLAERGVKFISFYVQVSLIYAFILPLWSFDTIFVGLVDLQLNARIAAMSVKLVCKMVPLSLVKVVISHMTGNYFKDADYSTNFIGQWHLDQRYLNQTPNARGYDHFSGILGVAVDLLKAHWFTMWIIRE